MSKKVFLYSIFSLFATVYLSAQSSKNLDENIVNLTSISDEQLSFDGELTVYSLENRIGKELHIKSTKGLKHIKVVGGANAVIVPNSHNVAYSISADTLCIYQYDRNKLEKISGVTSWSISEDGKWIGYTRNEPMKRLFLINTVTFTKSAIESNVSHFIFSPSGHTLLTLVNTLHSSLVTLTWTDLNTSRQTILSKSLVNPSGFTFNKNERKLLFLDADSTWDRPVQMVKEFSIGDDSVADLLDEQQAIALYKNYDVIGINVNSFFLDSNILIDIKKVKEATQSPVSDVVVWSHQDSKLKSEEEKLKTHPFANRSFCIYSNSNKNLKVYDPKAVDFWSVEPFHVMADDYLVATTSSNWSERYYNKNKRGSLILIALNSSRVDTLARNIFDRGGVSAFGHFILWFERETGHYFSYNIITKATINVTKDIPTKFYDDEFDQPFKPPPFDILGWSKDDESVFIYDKYDIWKVDPSGISLAINLTCGYGLRNRNIFRAANFELINKKFGKAPIIDPANLILASFDRTTKDNGFYKLGGSPLRLTKLVMKPESFYFPDDAVPSDGSVGRGRPIVKASNAQAYLLEINKSSVVPELYFTNNFRVFTKLTSLDTLIAFPRVNSEIIRWKKFDLQLGEGVLYKPQNFDSSKKYPVIFYYYERLSNGLNRFQIPSAESNGAMNIPYFVNNGYLVFTPDIVYTIGKPGESAYNAVVSAARYLSRFSWVDSTKMGLQGISFGAYETNYIISKTNSFAAASSSAGVCDLVSAYNDLRPGFGVSNQYHSEVNQGRIGATLWERPDLYISNSPIFYADKVTTPLLIEHGDQDQAVPFSQAIEWFTALRRLNKRVWLLQYKGEGHGLGKSVNQLDFSRRLKQFFDHYLKGAKMPDWMTEHN